MGAQEEHRVPSPLGSSASGRHHGHHQPQSPATQNVIAEGVGVSLSGGLARRARMRRHNSAPESAVLDPPSKFTVGVCAMEKKARSKPMTAILSRITSFNEFEVIVFGDKMILETPVEDWPVVDCLLSWHSDGFPLHKAQAYVQLRHPFCVNDSMAQEILLDRRRVYKTLKDNGIPVPHHIIVNRNPPVSGQQTTDGGAQVSWEDPPGFVEDLDWVELDGVRLTKPFVEKPVSGEDHNIYIYYHSSHGGGVKKLFRKVDDKSADYDPKHPGNVRRNGSFIYEEFLTTGGTDVKVYTVGPRYAHAEARKSPVVDGKVHRTSDGKEMRYPVLLSPQEKEIARMVCLAFSQKVCGFDLLRSEKGKSYVCDVNGWSFVKNSTKYLDDAAGILRSMILMALAPQRVMTMPMLLPVPIAPVTEEGEEEHHTHTGDELGLSPPNRRHSMHPHNMKEVQSLQDVAGQFESGNEHEELRCVLAVVRHGDRTPKQKLKFKATQPALLALFDKHRNSKGDQAKLKSPIQLQEFLAVVRVLCESIHAALADLHAGRTPTSADYPQLGNLKLDIDSLQEFEQQMTIVRTVMEQGGGRFSGVNRKVQIKPIKPKQPTLSPTLTEPPPPTPTTARGDGSGAGFVLSPTGARVLSQTQSFSVAGLGAAHSADIAAAAAVSSSLDEALVVVKWGGVLTHAGRHQAERLGQLFRASMYPRHGPAGGGLLRLHSTYRHDLKIYSSDEGRVQVSAAAFAKGLLDLEGNSLTPILVSLVNKDASMLEAFGKGASEEMQACKNVIQTQLTHDLSKGPPPPIKSVLPVPLPLLGQPSNPSPPITPALTVTPPSTIQINNNNTNSNTAGAVGYKKSLLSSVSMGTAGGQEAAAGVGGGNGNGGGGLSSASSPARGPSPAPPAPDPRAAAPYRSQRSATQLVTTPHPGLLAEGAGGLTVTLPSDSLLSETSSVQRTESVPGNGSNSTNGESGSNGGGGNGGTGSVSVFSGGGDSGRPTSPEVIQLDTLMHMPENPLALLQSLRALMKVLVDKLHDMCAEESQRESEGVRVPIKEYNTQSQAPEEWELQAEHPCGGERLMLLLDRWRKLYDALYSDKKQQFDISKIPDIYDSAKHDAIHNAHLGLPLQELYRASKALADVVIPQEYGLEPHSKLSIGSKIAKELVGKLLADMSSMKIESELTAVEASEHEGEPGEGGLRGAGTEDTDPYSWMEDTMATEFGRHCLEDEQLRNRHGNLTTVSGSYAGHHAPDMTEGGHGHAEGHEGSAGDDPLQEGARHRLCPTYASDINSPLRHVRTRIYYTSESHIHSLVNVLRFCHMARGGKVPLVGDAMQRQLDFTPEHDYLTHVVLRMFENLSVPVGDPARFRVEVLFSPGAAADPFAETPADHALHAVPMQPLNSQAAGTAQTFQDFVDLLAPFGVARKVDTAYALSVALRAPSQPLSRTDSMAGSLHRAGSGTHMSGKRPSGGGASHTSGGGACGSGSFRHVPTLTRGHSNSATSLTQLEKQAECLAPPLCLSPVHPHSPLPSSGSGSRSHAAAAAVTAAAVAAATPAAACELTVDGSTGGAGGSAMGGVDSELSRFASLPPQKLQETRANSVALAVQQSHHTQQQAPQGRASPLGKATGSNDHARQPSQGTTLETCKEGTEGCEEGGHEEGRGSGRGDRRAAAVAHVAAAAAAGNAAGAAAGLSALGPEDLQSLVACLSDMSFGVSVPLDGALNLR